MSSTGRGPRLGGPDDYYVTPSWTVRRLLEAWHPPGGLWLEPGAGNGAIIRAVNDVRSDVEWIAVEVREQERAALESTGASVRIADFLGPATPRTDIAVVLGNPPFSLAQEFIDQSRIVAPNATVCLLLRLNFVGSADRAPFLRRRPPDIKSLPNRPPFWLGKTDSIEYGWLIFPPGERAMGTFQVLALTSAKERARDVPQSGRCNPCEGLGLMLAGWPAKKKTPNATTCGACHGFGKVKTGPSEVELEWQRADEARLSA